MANKNQTTKRRVAAAGQAERREATANKQQRRQRLMVGGLTAFLALALLAPLTAGLLNSSNDADATDAPPTSSSPTDASPPTTVSIPWVTEDRAGATIVGPTPCPATDGSEQRTTGFELAPPLCIEAGSAFELTFDTPAGSFAVPVESLLDIDAANLAVVFGRYRTYEQTPVLPVTGGLLAIGSGGDTGFTIPATPPTGANDELYPIGSVVAVADTDDSLAGSLVVVLEDTGSALLALTPRHVVIGMIDDLADIQAVYDSSDSEELLLIDSVTVSETS